MAAGTEVNPSSGQGVEPADSATVEVEQGLAIFREALDAILIADDDRRYIMVNPAACALFGMSREELLQHHIEDFFGGDDPAQVDAMWQRFRAAKRLAGEFPLRRPDGTTRTVEFRAIADFVPGRHLSIIRDITERLEESERARVEAVGRARAEAESRVKDEFLAILGHELRNPLAPILNALELMSLQASPCFENERRIIERNTRHLASLVNDLLDISRITSGELVLHRRPVRISAVVAETLEMAGPILSRRAHRLETKVPPELVVDGDHARLVQVITNLVMNAAKYTAQGGHIAITAEREGSEVAVRVRDDGAGIPPELLPHVFEPFVQGERTLEQSQGGLGIGLSLVQRLVELHGGTVGVTSELGTGTELTVRLPVSDTAAAQSEPKRQALLHAGMPARRRVLIVDDNQDAADLLTQLLHELGYATAVAYDGASALREAEAFHPQVALLDIGLPDMDGCALATQLRALPGQASLQLIALSGYGRPEDLARSGEAGFHAHIVKPVGIGEILRALGDAPAANRSPVAP